MTAALLIPGQASFTSEALAPFVYTIGAAKFDPNGDADCRLQRTAAISPDTPTCSWAGWTFIPEASADNAAPTFCDKRNSNSIEVPGSFYNVAGDAFVHAHNLENGGSDEYVAVSAGAELPSGEWMWLAGNLDVGHAAGNRTHQFYRGDTALVLSPDNGGTDVGVAFNIPFTTNIDPAMISSNGQVLYFADVFVWPGQLIDWSVGATRRLLYDEDGKPVDPTAAFAAFGRPAMAFVGAAADFNNQGTAGRFTNTQGLITDAPTTPYD